MHSLKSCIVSGSDNEYMVDTFPVTRHAQHDSLAQEDAIITEKLKS